MKIFYSFLLYTIANFVQAQCPTPTITPLTRTLTCNGAPQTFTAVHNSTVYTVGAWYNPNYTTASTGTASTNVLYANSPGTYTYYAYDSSFTCVSSQTVLVLAPPSVPTMSIVQPYGTVAITCYSPCMSHSIISTSSLAPLTYTWTNLTTSISSMPANSVYSICTTDYYRAEFKDGNACVVSQTIAISTLTDVGTPISPNDYTVCSTPTVLINANTTLLFPGSMSYIWTGPAGSTITSPNSYSTAVDFAGTYTVAMKHNFTGCIEYNTANVSACTRIDNLSSNELISLFPNPNNGQFILKIDKDLQAGELVLSNYLGQEVYRQKILKGINAIKTNTISSGVYIYTILNKNESLAKGKIVIE